MNMSSYKCCASRSAEFKKIVSLSALLKLIAEESRLKLLCVLAKGEHCVCELVEHFDMSQSLISHHLADMKQVGLVAAEKRGLRVYYRPTKLGAKVMGLLGKI